MHAALTLVLLAATSGSVGRRAGDTTPAQPAGAIAAAQCAAVAAAPAGDEARPPAPVPVNGSIEANELPNQLAVLFEYIGLFPNEMASRGCGRRMSRLSMRMLCASCQRPVVDAVPVRHTGDTACLPWSPANAPRAPLSARPSATTFQRPVRRLQRRNRGQRRAPGAARRGRVDRSQQIKASSGCLPELLTRRRGRSVGACRNQGNPPFVSQVAHRAAAYASSKAKGSNGSDAASGVLNPPPQQAGLEVVNGRIRLSHASIDGRSTRP